MSEFQKKLLEAKDKAQEGLSEFQKKMQEKQEFGLARTKVRNNTGKGNVIRALAFDLDLASNNPGLYYEHRKVVNE